MKLKHAVIAAVSPLQPLRRKPTDTARVASPVVLTLAPRPALHQRSTQTAQWGLISSRRVKMHAPLRSLVIVAFCLISSTMVAAQEYPSRTIDLVVGNAAGGPADIFARVLADQLKARLGQAVVVENRTGGVGGLIAARYVAAAKPDGYTLLLGTPAIATFSVVLKNPDFELDRDLRAVAPFGEVYHVLVTSSKFSSVTELVKYGRANPGKLNFGTYGSTNSIQTRYFNKVAGIEAAEIPFRGAAPAHTALMNGTIDYVITTPGAARPVTDTGKGSLVGIASNTRLKEYPNIPTLRENEIDVGEFKAWYPVFAPRRTPDSVVALLNREISAIAQLPEVKEKLAPLNFNLTTSSPQELQDYVAEQQTFLLQKAKEMGIKPQ